MTIPEPQHARLGPSNHRWPNCPGSVREEAPYPDIPGEAAIDGTGSHLLLELCLNEKRRAESFLGEIIGANHEDKPNGWNVLQDRVDRVQECLDYINARHQSLTKDYPGHKIIVAAERRADPGGMFGRDDWWGTCDITIAVVNDHNRCIFLEVIDYKDGRMWVGPKSNTQLISYLIGQLRPFIASGPELVRPHEWHKIGNDCRVTIVQPKTNPTVRSDDLTSTEIGEWAEKLRVAAIDTDDPDAALIPDDKGGKGYCKWCKHKDNCTALGERDLGAIKAMTTNVISTDGGGIDLFSFSESLMKNAELMPVEQLVQLADLEPGIMSIFDMARKEIERRVKAEPDSVPGWAIKPGRGSKVYNEKAADIAKILKGKRIKQDFIYPKKLVTPAALLKNKEIPQATRDKIEKELVSFKAGDDSLQRVPVKEKTSVEEMFGDVDFNQPAAPADVSFF